MTGLFRKKERGKAFCILRRRKGSRCGVKEDGCESCLEKAGKRGDKRR